MTLTAIDDWATDRAGAKPSTLTVTPVENGYIVQRGVTQGYLSTEMWVARSHAELCRLLRHIAVKDKMSQ